MKLFKKGLAEFIGTFVLVLFGCGAAAMTSVSIEQGGYADPAGHLVGTALAFGLALCIMVYAVGSVSGCHVNPAVSLGVLLKNLFLPKEKREFGWKEFFVYVVAQILGALVAVLGLRAVISTRGGFGANTIQPIVASRGQPILIACIAEILLTGLFVFTVLAVTSNKKFRKIGGVVLGGALTVVHIFGIPLTGTSVNPARSIAPAIAQAIFAKNYTALNQLWIFIVCPLVGACIAAIMYFILFVWKKEPEEECCCKHEASVVNNIVNNYYGEKPAEEAKEETPVAAEEVKEEPKEAEEPVVEEKVEEKIEETVTEESVAEETVEETAETPEVKAARKKAVPFMKRLEEADPDLKSKYEELAAYCDEYGLHGRMSVSHDTYRLHKVRYVVFSIRGKAIKMHVAVDPKAYENTTMTIKDDSSKEKYSDVPGYIRVKSTLSVKRAKQLIDDAMAKAGIEKKAK